MGTGAPAWTDLGALADLRRQAGGADPAAVRAAAREFEGLLLGELMGKMRGAALAPGALDGAGSALYFDLFDRQLGNELAAAGGFGLADALARALPGGDAPGAAAPTRSGGWFPVPRAVGVAPGPTASGPGFGSPAEFVAALWPHAQAAGQALGVDGRVLLAQAALETGWGAHLPGGAHGASSHNLFGIKATGDWDGPAVRVPTLEYRDGVMARESAAFRAYSGYAESFADYARLIGTPRYAAAHGAGANAAKYLQALAGAGYATDPDYAAKVQALLAHPAFGALTVAQQGP